MPPKLRGKWALGRPTAALEAKEMREAERMGMPFGNICDPLGRPTERGLAVLHHANETGRGEAFLLSFLKGVWADGLDGGSEGARWSADRATAWRLSDGKPGEKISLEEAAQIAERVGLSVPGASSS